MSNTVCIIQARMGSSRLPGKSLRALNGRPIIAHVVERARAIVGVDLVVIATSLLSGDDAIEAMGVQLGVDVVRGSEWDVLDRFLLAATRYEAETIVRVTGDCPFLCPQVAALTVEHYYLSPFHVDYLSNDTTCSGYPDGTDVEVFSNSLLRRAAAGATHRQDREHVTAWMRRAVTTGMLKSATDWSRHKLSVDTVEDYDFAVSVARHLEPGKLDLAHTMEAVERAKA